MILEGAGAPGHTTGNLPDCEEPEADSSESRDVVPELSSAAPSGKGRRLRSETESRSSKGTSIFVPFIGRKRSHTLQDVGGDKEKEEQEDVRDGGVGRKDGFGGWMKGVGVEGGSGVGRGRKEGWVKVEGGVGVEGEEEWLKEG